ncbi:MAG: DUF2817 domain-containing protein, partial [Myxococcales bacterium]|nr:DUF2817 domain-containing protein [Myxococcales bacterium]
MNYATLEAHIRAVSDIATVSEYGRVTEGGREYALLRVDTPGARRLLITSGFHGEEPAGPRTLALHVREVLDAARALKVGVSLFPCVNPSGFEHGTRYNASGHGPNNDFIRYEGLDGEEIPLLRPGQPYRAVHFAEGIPAETAALRSALAAEPPPDAALDIHQDDYIEEPCFYVYVFGERPAFGPVLAASRALVRALADTDVDSGYAPGEGLSSDGDACIEFQDGSITDWMRYRGAPFCAALETTTATPFSTVSAVNMAWV